MKTSAAKKDSYHHGDLRSALIETGLRLLETTESAAIGLREVARETGVSATAVYRHFPDKGALLAALAAKGYQQLVEAQDAAQAKQDNRADAFRATGQAYVHFAVANPALFRLMTAHMRSADEIARADAEDCGTPGTSLGGNIATLLPADATQQQRDIAAVQSLALVHGLAELILGGQIPNDPDLINAAVGQFGSWRR